ncbi:MAG: peptidoglycan DD-metalloendopeptidase family protein [Bacteroidetes bacterium]|uniref:Peptidoglycan DD-metalloendopeptidase family protein n=1 Tax=Candidatus Cryptobacteroides avistercoris TaxID=2840758 RepID=A0A9D9NN02_9BACT|nr:peptidoglycan DD-metalloendopeptidase family protein [Candidatus Cryptobacteroides avistercoris]
MKFIRIFLTVFLLLAAAAPSFSQDTREQESRRSALEKEIAQLEQQIAENISRSSSALNDLTLIRKQVETRKALVAESERQIMMIDDSITLTTANIAGLQARIDTLTSYFGRLVRSAYKNRDARVWYVYILTSRNFGQATRRYSYLKNLSSTLNDEAAQVKEMRAGLELELTRLDSLKVQATQLRDAQQKELAGLRAEEKRSDDLVSQLKRYRTRYQRQLETKRKQVEDLNREIERIIAEYIAEQKAREEEQRRAAAARQGEQAAAEAPAPVVDYELAAEFESNKGKLPWPADGPVLEKFGRHNHPVYTNIVMPFSNGISIGLAKGSAVRAVFDGEVKNVIAMPGYNMCVLVQHGSYFTFYCKLGQVSVKAGDKVSTGSIIGTVDTIDGQTQLHFQIWKEKSPQNPEIWLRSK